MDSAHPGPVSGYPGLMPIAPFLTPHWPRGDQNRESVTEFCFKTTASEMFPLQSMGLLEGSLGSVITTKRVADVGLGSPLSELPGASVPLQ